MGDIWKMLIDEGMQWVQPTRQWTYGRETSFGFFDCSLPSANLPIPPCTDSQNV